MNFQHFTFKKDNVIVVNFDKKDFQKQNEVSYESVHHVHVLDRSGSMYDSIDELIENVKLIVKEMGEKDYLTVVWFSSNGEYRTLLKGARKFDKIDDLLNSIKSVLHCTCFSDPLKEVNLILDELSYLNVPVSVTLFTDGQPVVPWSVKEEETKIFEQLELMRSKVIAFNTVGYGNYYHKELLVKMASFSEFGSMFHSSKIEEYFSIFKNSYEKINDLAGGKIDISNSNINDAVIYLNRKFTKMEYGDYSLSSIDKEKNQFFVVCHDYAVRHQFWINDDVISFHEKDEGKFIDINLGEYEKINAANDKTIENFMYAYAYNLYYQGKRKESLEVLKEIKDKQLIDSHMNAFTYDETSIHLKNIENALLEPSKYRFANGKCDDNYIPGNDSTCVFDILEFLAKNNCLYIPYSPYVEKYNRIGRKRTDEYNLFKEKDKEKTLTPFSEIVYNRELMNISLRSCIEGTVNINPKAAARVGLDKVIESRIFRNHALISNGFLNIKMIDVLVPSDKYHQFMKLSTDKVDSVKQLTDTFDENYERFLIDLTQFPIINQRYIDNSTIENIFDMAVSEFKYQCRQKLLGYYIDKMTEKGGVFGKVGALKDFTVEQIEVLKEHGLDKNLNYAGVSNKTPTVEESTDYYESKKIKFYIAGCSDVPKVDDMFDRVNDGKKLTTSMQFLFDENEVIKDEFHMNPFIPKTLKERDTLIEMLDLTKKELITIRSNMAVFKMAKILTGDWFDDLKFDEKKKEYYYEKDGVKMNASIDKVKIYL